MSDRCPVCDRADLAEDLDRCPQCGADLECFRLLDALPESVSAPQEHTAVDAATIDARLDTLQARLDASMRTQRRLTLTVLAALVLVGTLTLALNYRSASPTTQQVPAAGRLPPSVDSITLTQWDAIASRLDRRLTEAREELSTRLAGIAQHLDTLEATLRHPVSPTKQARREPAAAIPAVGTGIVGADQGATILYHPRHGDSLWKIAKDHLGQGHLYPLLLEWNPGLGIDFSPRDGPIRILANRRKARDRMAELTLQRGRQGFFRARVLPGDDWQRLSKRYYGRIDQAARLRQLNGGMPIPVTERVLIPLW